MSKATDFSARLEQLGEALRHELRLLHEARERALRSSREVIQLSSRSIRATHRGEFSQAARLSTEAGAALEAARAELADHPAILHAGYVQDAAKEFAESAITLALVSGEHIPSSNDLRMAAAPYLNGLAEAASELRRSALDALREGRTDQAARALTLMDEVFGVLETVDFPEAVTGGLRRTMDALRGVVERTRGDVTSALRQDALERRLKAFERRL